MSGDGHASVLLSRGGEQAVAIDVGIAPLIEALWARGIETVASCEDGGTSAEGGLPAGLAWIGFPDERHASRFCALGRDAILSCFPLDPEIRSQAARGGIPPDCRLVTFPTREISHLAESARS